MSITVSMVAPALQDRFQQQVIGKVRGLVEALFNAVMKQEQLFFLDCLPYERSAQRRGHRNGYQHRFLESRWGTLSLQVPRSRNTASPFRSMLIDRYRRRRRHLEALICHSPDGEPPGSATGRWPASRRSSWGCASHPSR